MDTKINLESLLTPGGTPLTATPATGSSSFAQAFLQQLKGLPETAGDETPQILPVDSLIKSMLAKLSDAASPAKSDKALPTGLDAPPQNPSTPDTSAVNPMIAALLNVVPPAQPQTITQDSAAPQLGVGVIGNSADTARALRQIMATIAQANGSGEMTKAPVVSQKGLPMAAPPAITITPKPITPAIEPAPKPITTTIAPEPKPITTAIDPTPTPKPITPTDSQATTFIPPAGPDGIMTPSTKPPAAKPITPSQIGAVSPLNGKAAATQDMSPNAIQPAAQNNGAKNPETFSQAGAGQNSSDAEPKKKAPDADQLSPTPVQTSDPLHTQSANVTILSQPATQSGLPNQHSTAAASSAPAAPTVIAANDTAAPRIVHEARLMQAAGQAEMQVSMRSDSAGTVSVKAILEGSHLSATVSAPSVETREWLVNNLHELHAGLSRDDLSLRSFQVSDPSLPGGWNGSDAHQQQSREQYRSSANSGGNFGTPDEPLAGADLNHLDLNETASQALSLHA